MRLAHLLVWAGLLLASVGCGGSAATTSDSEPAGIEADAEGGAETPRCVDAPFARPPQDQGLVPPPGRVTPGDSPAPDCPEDE